MLQIILFHWILFTLFRDKCHTIHWKIIFNSLINNDLDLLQNLRKKCIVHSTFFVNKLMQL